MKKFGQLMALLLILTSTMVSQNLSAQVRLVRNHKPVSRIVVTTSIQRDSIAAALLQDFVERSTGARLPILRQEEVKRLKKGDVLIGNGMSNQTYRTDLQAQLKEDGYLLSTADGFLRILSGKDKGSIYGVTSFLEKYLGVNYWGENEYSIDRKSDLAVPCVALVDNPAFRHRQTHFYGLSDPFYEYFSHYEWIKDKVPANMWVHTFRRLLPCEKYGKEHPEYYAFINGARRPRNVSQPCLTNPEVLEIVTHQLDSLFKAHPDKEMISVSQVDGNNSWCRCEECQKVMDEEGSVSGPYIRFVNELARRFPDKVISTLSYLFTVVPPKKVKPLPNVNIMLCNINCTRELPLDQTESGKKFMTSLEKWSSMTDNIFLWDYGTNFHNYLAPFPNFHVMAENMKLFRKNHVEIYFHQLGGFRGEAWAELRTWLVSKLMWNPDADVDELIWYFLKGYYGEASAPYLYQYIKLMEGALVGSGQTLWIYDTPVTFKNGMLNPAMRKKYNALFDQAEEAAQGDSTYIARLHRSRLQLLFSDLEIDRTYPGYEFEPLSQKLDLFEKWCHEFGVLRMTEPGLMTEDYIRSYRERYLKEKPVNLAAGAKVEFLIPSHPRYDNIASVALTDGQLGSARFNSNWLGWEATDGDFIVDLGEEKEFSVVEMDCLLAYNDWIWPLKSARFSISSDKEHFTELGLEKVDKKTVKGPYYQVGKYLDHKVRARYLRFEIEGQKFMPSSGNPCWFFIDEVMVH